jgi:hypothetical protein
MPQSLSPKGTTEEPPKRKFQEFRCTFVAGRSSKIMDLGTVGNAGDSQGTSKIETTNLGVRGSKSLRARHNPRKNQDNFPCGNPAMQKLKNAWHLHGKERTQPAALDQSRGPER